MSPKEWPVDLDCLVSESTPLAICILGRGIEKARTKRGDVWRPTRYIEKPTEKGAHSGWRVRGVQLQDETSLIAGANANLLGACQLFEEVQANNKPPALVIFAAGRAKYLESDADIALTEGKILSQAFSRRVKPTSATSLIILEKNRDTKDDLDESLRLANANKIERLAVITVGVHIARATEFAKAALCQYAGPKVIFIPSEQLLARRYCGRSTFAIILAQCAESKAYFRTAHREWHGIEALRAGTYVRAK